MKYILLIFVLFSSSVDAEPEFCPLDDLTDFEYVDLECQFYLGTKAYRSKIYGVAAAHWQYVVDTPAKYENEEKLKVMALGTVTFLTYKGLGVKQDKNKAVKSWKVAASQGGFEARRQLGYAYSDNDYEKKDLVKALGWYKSMFLLHPDQEKLKDGDKDIYQDGLDGAKKLEKKMTLREIELADKYAKSVL